MLQNNRYLIILSDIYIIECKNYEFNPVLALFQDIISAYVWKGKYFANVDNVTKGMTKDEKHSQYVIYNF